MPFTGQELFERAEILLNDADSVRWPVTELVRWANDGLRQIAMSKPSAVAQSVTVDLVEGTYQTLAANHVQFLRAVANVTSAANITPEVRGRAIRPIERTVLDQQFRDWHNSAAVPYTQQVEHITFDPQDPRSYNVFPGNDGTGRVALILAVLPDAIAKVGTGTGTNVDQYTDDVDLNEIYLDTLLNFILFKAHSKDSATPSGARRAAAHLQLFQASLGLKMQSEATASPDTIGAAGQ